MSHDGNLSLVDERRIEQEHDLEDGSEGFPKYPIYCNTENFNLLMKWWEGFLVKNPNNKNDLKVMRFPSFSLNYGHLKVSKTMYNFLTNVCNVKEDNYIKNLFKPYQNISLTNSEFPQK